MPLAHVNGIDLYYEIEGKGDWLVFAHGGDGNHLCWWRQVAALSPHYRCLTYDARGFGLSGGEAGDPASSAADDLQGLLDHIGIERALLVGHSMGGLAVAGVAQKYPERARALVMSDSIFGFQTAAMSRWAAGMLEKIPAGFNVLEHLFTQGFATAEPELHYLYRGLCRLNSTRPRPRNTGDYLEAYVRMRDTPPVDYSGFTVPTLFIVGGQDELTLPWVMEETARAVGGAELVAIQGAGHSPFLEQTAVYNRILLDFLERAAGRQ
jgi:pimeloyl-ACP methyl ester carboxylesterase